MQNKEMLFKDFISINEDEIKKHMAWENYNLNTTVIPVVDLVQDHALLVLSKSYGLFHVEQNILDEFCADIFIYFPILLQQLSITRLIDAYGVVTDDEDTVTTTRSEKIKSEVDQDSKFTAGTASTEINISNNSQTNTGTIKSENDISNVQSSSTNIHNSSGVESTGSKSVNLSHNMPEQALDSTGKFPTDSQGTPKLTTSYVSNAAESFNTSNPINSNETSKQDSSNTQTGSNDNTTTNDITVSDNGSNTRTNSNSGYDKNDSKIKTDATNEIVEKTVSLTTNKQYAYEIKAFLETADGLIAFSRWEDKFSWVVGII